MSRVGIVALSVPPRDAVGHDVLQMQRLLGGLGHDVAVFSSHWFKKDPTTRDASEADAFLADDPEALLIYHHAVGWPAGVELVQRARCRRVVRYHNVTPARFFSGYSTSLMKLCQQGREQLLPLARAGCELYLSDSAYNEGELIRAGADPARCRVVPPFHQVDRLAAVEPDPEVLRDCRDGCVNVLFVGRRAPNKGHRFLLDAFAAYVGHYEPHARLLLVGREEPALCGYGNQLRAHARYLGIHDRVVFIQEATEAALRAYYEAAHVFLLASEHEGFCVPVIEAMAQRVPVVAYGTTAVPETVGDAGLVWDEPDPFLLAESIDCLVRDPAARARLTERGWRRYQERFTNLRLETEFLSALLAARIQPPPEAAA
jgi:glycosyltransferase involved in cell wall biosynthesis